MSPHLRTTFRPHIGWIGLGLALTCAMQSPAQAAPEAVPAAGLTAAQVQTYRAGPGRQRWRDAAAQMAQLRQAPPNPAMADLWRALDAGVNRPSGTHPLAWATTAQSLPELEGKTAWLRGQVLGGQADGRYSYSYAFNLARLGRFGDHLMEAAIFLAHGRLAMQIDTDRCTDPNVAMDTMAEQERQALMRGMDSAIQTLTPRQQATALLEAVVLEDTLGERPPQAWLCAVRLAPSHLTEVQTPQGDVGRTFVLNPPQASTLFVDEATWRAARRLRLDKMAQSLLPNL
ncbi:hypothetical protein [Aquabacterium sp.]|uniref:hypothetical protein n=1 Tax=Aquabacterium sp. TaxID=1872578 RepID=UPI0025BD9518|nr:hypothetical protein [Aquabacterium sp.]